MTAVREMLARGRSGREREVRKQVDQVIAPKRAKFEAHIQNGERFQAWDHCLEMVVFTVEEGEVKEKRGKLELAGC